MIRARRALKPDPVESAVSAMEAEEVEILNLLAPVDELGIAHLHQHSPTALAAVDRLVAKRLVTRYDGGLFGVSDLGRKRLSPPAAAQE